MAKLKILVILILCTVPLLYSQMTVQMKKERGVYTVPCTVNGLKLRFVFDTGASKVTISLTEALFMLKNDYLSEQDIRGASYAELANGEVAENTEVVLKLIEIGDFRLHNVSAAVVHNLGAPLLLGQSAIERLGVLQMDGDLLTIVPRPKSQPSTSTNPKEQTPDGQRYCAVFPKTPIYDIPDMFNGKVLAECEDVVEVLGWESNKYVKIRFKEHTGYIWSGFLK